MQLARAIPEAKQQHPGCCGNWSPQQLLAHIAGWDWEGQQVLRLKLANMPIPPEENNDTFNAKAIAARQQLSWDEVVADVEAAHAALAGLCANVSQEHARQSRLFGQVLQAMIREYLYNGDQLAAWVE